ncbi:hypothetical protein Lesp02_06300 [Lentzea sp. NBRC 105346]|nr:hypothetical protein Lesp02_06300 [Lentzea sp. NBRC 105346]
MPTNASTSPESTNDDGPFTAATDRRGSSGTSDTTAMPPRPAILRNARLRNATTRAPSSSDNAPATTAAAISPCECPTTASGSTPYDRHSAASDTITAHNAGCTTSTRSTSSRSNSTNGASASAHSPIRAANTGEDSNNSRAIPTHCEP